MSILSIKDLSHVYDFKVLFEDASLVINNGEHAGIVGLNGAGKTTFMNILSGNVLQDKGEVKWLNGIRWGYLDQHADIDRNQTVMEYLKTSFDHLYETESNLNKLYDKMCDADADELERLINKTASMQEYLDRSGFYDLEARIKKVANGLGVNNFGYDTPVGNLSGGQRAKLMLSKLLLEDLDVMLLDEPTNFLDLEHIEWLKKFLDSFEGTFLLISHDTAFLNAVCKLIISVENREIKRYSGNYDKFVEQHESNARQYAENYERQQREIKKMEDYIARNAARAATAGMANSRKKMLERIDVLAKPTTVYESHFNFPYILINTKCILNVDKLSVGYTAPILPPVSFAISSSDKLWLRGTNGLGKTTILKTIMKKLPALGGKSEFHINSKVSYIEQDLEFPNKNDNAIAFMNSIHPKMNLKEVRGELAKVGIIKDLSSNPICNLSGGEQVKIKLCSLMQNPSNILILDEPTNHLDVLAKQALLEALEHYEGALILVSHEPAFAEKLCNKIFDVENV